MPTICMHSLDKYNPVEIYFASISSLLYLITLKQFFTATDGTKPKLILRFVFFFLFLHIYYSFNQLKIVLEFWSEIKTCCILFIYLSSFLFPDKFFRHFMVLINSIKICFHLLVLVNDFTKYEVARS